MILSTIVSIAILGLTVAKNGLPATSAVILNLVPASVTLAVIGTAATLIILANPAMILSLVAPTPLVYVNGTLSIVTT